MGWPWKPLPQHANPAVVDLDWPETRCGETGEAMQTMATATGQLFIPSLMLGTSAAGSCEQAEAHVPIMSTTHTTRTAFHVLPQVTSMPLSLSLTYIQLTRCELRRTVVGRVRAPHMA